MAAIVGLWISTVALGHLFAACFLLKAALLGRSSGQNRKEEHKAPSGQPQPQQLQQQQQWLHNGSDDELRGSADNCAAALTAAVTAAAGAAEVKRNNPGSSSPLQQSKELDITQFKYKSPTAGDAADEPCSSTICALFGHEMALQLQPVCLEWTNIGCSYQQHGKVVTVLSGVWGQAAPGDMQALLGPSGSGKSTLMDILSCRKTLGSISGQLLVNGQPVDISPNSSFANTCAYVPQEDCFIPTMSCYETLDFHAQLVLPGHWSQQWRHTRVMEVLEILGLASCSGTLVGGRLPGGLLLRGLSGGERKRLSIAACILAAPAVIFLDEPTSGLDSFAALNICGRLQQMAQTAHHVVLASIHQPRSAIWQMFNQVTLLSSGHLMYSGPISHLVAWFESLGFHYSPLSGQAVSDWVVDLVAVGFVKSSKYFGVTFQDIDELAAAAEAFLQHYHQHVQCALTPKTSRRHTGPHKSLEHNPAAWPGSNVGHMGACRGRTGLLEWFGCHIAAFKAACNSSANKRTSPGCCGFWKQFKTLLWRELLTITRNPFDCAGRALTYTWVGMLIGLLFYNMPSDTDIMSLRNRPSLCYACLWFVILMPYISMSLYAEGKRFYLADQRARLFKPLPYYLAKVAAAAPFQVVCVLLFGWTVYGMAGLRAGPTYMLKFGLVMILSHMVAAQVLHCAAVLCPNTDTAFMISMLWTSIQVLYASFFNNNSEVQSWLRWVDCMYFALEALVTNEMEGSVIDCSAGLPHLNSFIITTLPSLSGRLSAAMVQSMSRPQPSCVISTAAIIRYFDFSRSFAASVVVLLAHLGTLHLLTFLALQIVAKQEMR